MRFGGCATGFVAVVEMEDALVELGEVAMMLSKVFGGPSFGATSLCPPVRCAYARYPACLCVMVRVLG